MTTGTSERRRSPAAAFFDDLAGRGCEPLLKNVSGTIRFDLDDGGRVEHWSVSIDEGDVAVSHSRARADAVIRLAKSTFEGMIGGRVNAMAATLRGELVAEGDLSLMTMFQRVFPGPAGT
ncbi:MAG: SCP2 sterol-binding domain-containing protein [Acidimicrobiia bacterium]|nr:SCP2 sterol-binding domain-containing protein [Acidimicrobiia bacterium]